MRGMPTEYTEDPEREDRLEGNATERRTETGWGLAAMRPVQAPRGGSPRGGWRRALVRIVGRDGAVFAVPLGRERSGRNAPGDQGLNDAVGAGQRELPVGRKSGRMDRRVVRMPLDDDLESRVHDQEVGEAVERRPGRADERRLPGIEQNPLAEHDHDAVRLRPDVPRIFDEIFQQERPDLLGQRGWIGAAAGMYGRKSARNGRGGWSIAGAARTGSGGIFRSFQPYGRTRMTMRTTSNSPIRSAYVRNHGSSASSFPSREEKSEEGRTGLRRDGRGARNIVRPWPERIRGLRPAPPAGAPPAADRCRQPETQPPPRRPGGGR